MRLKVHLNDRLAGVLDNDDGSLRFHYDSTYLESDGAAALSQSLPLRVEPFGNRATGAFFENLLPEGLARQAIARAEGFSEENVISWLSRFGGDCAGAITVSEISDEAGAIESLADRDTSHGDRASRQSEHHAAEPITDERLDQLLSLADDVSPMSRARGSRLSLAGAQSKLPVIVDADGTLRLPGGSGRPTTHILKPGARDFDDIVWNELFCMRLAAAAGLQAAPVELRVTASGLAYLMVKRYDRASTPPGARIHQEDFCQALGVPPARKYQADGGPTLARCFAMIDDASAAPAADKLALWNAVVFNVLIGNCDAHAKNFSLLYDAHRPRLAPLYDLVSTAVYPESVLTRELAMSIGRARRLESVTSESLAHLAEAVGLRRQRAQARAAELCDTVVAAVDALSGEYAEIAVAGRVAAGVKERARRFGC